MGLQAIVTSLVCMGNNCVYDWLTVGNTAFIDGALSLQHVNRNDPEILQRGGLSGGAMLADSKKIYPIDISKTTTDSAVYACVFQILFSSAKQKVLRCVGIFHSSVCLQSLQKCCSWNFVKCGEIFSTGNSQYIFSYYTSNEGWHIRY